MNPRHCLLCSLVLSLTFALGAQAAEVFEIGEGNFTDLPGGKEADGIVGDFVLRNDQVAAVISGALPLRRPNMSAFYGEGNETPGCLYDLTRRERANDQITIFTPSGQRGPVSYVRLDESLAEGQVGIEVVVTAAKGGGLSRRHQYILADGWEGLLIVSTFVNDGKDEVEVTLGDAWTQMREKGEYVGIQWANAIDPADRCGYARAWVAEGGAEIPKEETVKLAAGATLRVARFLAVADSPAAALGLVAARRDAAAVGSVALKLSDPKGQAAASAQVDFRGDKDVRIPAYADAEGLVALSWPAGSHACVVREQGRAEAANLIAVSAGKETAATIKLGPLSQVQFAITGSDGGDTPCKVQFRPQGETPAPNLGPTDRAHGCVDQWHSGTGTFTVPLPAGDYELVITRGPEHDAISLSIQLAAGEEEKVSGQFVRSVSSPGWIAADFHNHSTPSGDNTCGTPDRLINLAAEALEFAPTTEHNRLYDWTPTIAKLGLAPFLATVPGMELTGSGAHFNSFPFTPDPRKQDGGAPVWQKDPRLNAIVLRDYQSAERDRWVHLNHPDMAENFVDRDGDGRADGGYRSFATLIDGLETQNYQGSQILAGAPFSLGAGRGGLGKSVNYHREFIWLQLLNQGLRVWGIGVADAHHVYNNGAGSWRTYLPSSSDDPAKIDWREMSRNAKAGRMMLSSGPYLEVSTGSGAIAGGFDRVSGELKLKVRVQCANWLDIDRVQVLVNGRQDPRYNYTRAANADMFGDGVVKFDHELLLDLSEDAHIIVVAMGENSTIERGFGTSDQAKIHPCAYHNPIFVDVNGGGFSPNYDTLGYELPVKNLSVDAVEALLGR